MMHAIFHERGRHISVTLWNLTVEFLVTDSYVLLKPTQVLSWGLGSSSESASSLSAVRKSGTRFLHTSETLNQFRLFAKLSRLTCLWHC